MYTTEQLKKMSHTELKELGFRKGVFPDGDRRYKRNWVKALADFEEPTENSPGIELEEVPEAIKPAAEAVETSPCVELQEPIESKFGRIVYPRLAAKVEPKMSQSAIAQSTENSPGVAEGVTKRPRR